MDWTTGIRFLEEAMKEFFFSSPTSRPDLGPIQLSIQWVPWVKRLEREDDHSPPSSAEVMRFSPYLRLHLPSGPFPWCLAAKTLYV